MSDFNFDPVLNASVQIKPRVQTAVFGDGYQQRVADGINTQAQSWQLTFVNTKLVIDSIEAFFKASAGAAAFTWTPYGFSEIKVICSEWTRNVTNVNMSSISCVFKQVFE